MSILSDLKPTVRNRQIDLVRQAGIDVSAWKNYSGGAKRAAANPKFCYEWVFIKPKKFVLFNLWHDMFRAKDGKIFVRLNSRNYIDEVQGVQKARAIKGDKAFQLAVREKLPIRVIVIAGRRQQNPGDKPSHVAARLLDPVSWRISKYDWKTGDCVITRGEENFIDQFSVTGDTGGKPKSKKISAKTFIRDHYVRTNVLIRAQGKCEWCGKAGFLMPDGKIYLETHHVVALSENGLDTESNVVALCPNHHREAHHGEKRTQMRKSLLKKLSQTYSR